MNASHARTASISLALALSLGFVGSAAGDDAVQATRPIVPDTQTDTRGAELAAPSARVELLELAFEASSKFPLNPHVKNRSRQQQRVVEALLELGESDRALALSAEIADWRRGVALAAIALHRAEKDPQAPVDALLSEALRIGDALAKDADSQAWRRDEIRALAARTHRALGDTQGALALEHDLTPSEAAESAAARARQAPAASFDTQLAQLDDIAATDGLDERRVALAGYAALAERFYADSDRRAQLEARARAAFDTLPVQIRIEWLLGFAESAIQHDDPTEALRIAKELRALSVDNHWLPQDQVPLTGRIAKLLFRAGDAEAARHELDVALAMYRSSEERIVDIFRSETLLPLAEARHALGDSEAARALYLEVLDAGALNPNARPRCEDLVSACLSLARNAVVLDDALWQRVRAINAGLVAPW